MHSLPRGLGDGLAERWHMEHEGQNLDSRQLGRSPAMPVHSEAEMTSLADQGALGLTERPCLNKVESDYRRHPPPTPDLYRHVHTYAVHLSMYMYNACTHVHTYTYAKKHLPSIKQKHRVLRFLCACQAHAFT